jgi:hypothetical protein
LIATVQQPVRSGLQTRYYSLLLIMLIVRNSPDTDLAGYPDNIKDGYRIFGEAGYPYRYLAHQKEY